MNLTQTLFHDSYAVVNPMLYPWDTIFGIPKSQKRILVIDDDVSMIELVKSVLSDEKDLKVFGAQDPYEAIEMMSLQVFDFIVLDWNLPNLNGLETLIEVERGFKFDPNLPLEWDRKKVRVIVLSGNERDACKVTNTKHFRYSGYINKGQAVGTIVNDLKTYLKKGVLL